MSGAVWDDSLECILCIRINYVPNPKGYQIQGTKYGDSQVELTNQFPFQL